MATRKKKSDSAEPVVTKGNHLTVTAYPDGRTELVWDDEALLNEVREAIASIEDVGISKKTRSKKKSSAE